VCECVGVNAIVHTRTHVKAGVPLSDTDILLGCVCVFVSVFVCVCVCVSVSVSVCGCQFESEYSGLVPWSYAIWDGHN